MSNLGFAKMRRNGCVSVNAVMLPEPEEFEYKVREFLNETIISECIYYEVREKLSRLSLHEFSEIDVNRVIKAFLITWGGMARVLKRREKWEDKLVAVIKRYSDFLERVRIMDLANLSIKELESLQDLIEKCYMEIREVVGPTSASKVLHIIAPEFFPLWDVNIRKMYKVSDSFRGYFRFMLNIRITWLEDSQLMLVLDRLEKEYDLSKLRLIDIYNFAVTRDSL